MKLDAIDIKILDFLQKDAKTTAAQMADKLALSPTPIYERIKKMEKSGVIKAYVAIVDPEKLNKGLIVFMNITIKDHSLRERTQLLRKLSSFQEVMELYHTSGAYDFKIKVRFNNVKAYRDFLVNEIAPLSNIADIDSQIVMEEIKATTYLKAKPMW